MCCPDHTGQQSRPGTEGALNKTHTQLNNANTLQPTTTRHVVELVNATWPHGRVAMGFFGKHEQATMLQAHRYTQTIRHLVHAGRCRFGDFLKERIIIERNKPTRETTLEPGGIKLTATGRVATWSHTNKNGQVRKSDEESCEYEGKFTITFSQTTHRPPPKVRQQLRQVGFHPDLTIVNDQARHNGHPARCSTPQKQ